MKVALFLVTFISFAVSVFSALSTFDRVTPIHTHRRRLVAAVEKQVTSSPSFSSSSGKIDFRKTIELGKQIANHSWEYGTTSMASLEVYNPELTVFSRNAFPHGRVPAVSNAGANVDALMYAKQHILLDNDTLSNGDGALGDPASLGVAALLLAYADGDEAQAQQYKDAAKRQYNHIQQGPRYANGAISQREDVAELWADAVYMFPPFLAYYAVSMNNQSALRQAVEQCGLYRDVLIANTTQPWQGLWTHIVGPQSQTLGIWATGNGWAALGMVRVLATVQHWHMSARWTEEQESLVTWILEILEGLRYVDVDPDNGMWRNYLVGGPDAATNTTVSWFGDGAGSSALVAAALRLAVLRPRLARKMCAITRNVRHAIAQRVDKQSGLLAPTVNPLDWYTTQPFNDGSPEGQAFVSMVGAAWRDCVRANICDPSE